ncbi:Inositol-1,4,5-trisphosphate 5-phosphatase 1 [Golovinomyces cichoracearum]|uniref:phosphoinositide 5-phosphatase n=1 Tax=Golovinomyces cichoracearum TaxID=62708 RepID=A0A420HK06_9PEZI|nr:Inositol-1,4,5-trisphosphate 5-phosphatase 1 [Golovinomyces cichoracearum]
MSIRVLLCEDPLRSIALVTKSHALTFRQCPSASELHEDLVLPVSFPDKSQPLRCIVEFETRASINLENYRPLSSLPIYGTLGLITFNKEIFICVVTGATKVAAVRPGETAEKINAVEFFCLSTNKYDKFYSDNLESYSAYDINAPNYREREIQLEQKCSELQKLLSDGSFYFSTNFDLTNRIQDRDAEGKSLDVDNMDPSFLWNSYMISPLVKFRSQLLGYEKEAFDSSRILTSAIRGFVLTLAIPSFVVPLKNRKSKGTASLTLISRLSCKRAGTRFNSRGIDDDGNVANFVESEIIYWNSSVAEKEVATKVAKTRGFCFSYVQIRGSVPIFWEQTAGLLPGQQKITITRSPDGAQPSFEKHFSELEKNYGFVHIINLLSETKPGEAELTTLYRKAVRSAKNKLSGEKHDQNYQFLQETEFDFHAQTKGPSGYEAASMICRFIKKSAKEYAYYLAENWTNINEGTQKSPTDQDIVASQQQGVFRTNCLDCLDRTNLIQTIISQMAIEFFLSQQHEKAASEFWALHSSLWADNGDSLSHIYAGTGALKSSFTRHGKMSFAGAIADARKSATRLYINNFADKGRQNTIDVLLGRLVGQIPIYLFDPINDYVTAELSKKTLEYQSLKNIKIWCGTFNLNGRTLSCDEDLSLWLCPGLNPAQQTPEIVATGFQEMVELSPQQIMNSDPTRREEWEGIILKTLNKQVEICDDESYILLRSGQLVGASLMIFVKKSVLANIRNVEGSVKKTGMSGMAGNKGAVAIRMDYANTSFCFVTAHLASGFANFEERNNEYATIQNGLRFQRNRVIDDHDTVIWFGDFNYRIELGIGEVKQLIKDGDLSTLYKHDQLNVQMIKGSVFPHYSESKITFKPTYKFDPGKDIYDTSEKARIPAWTDRVLLRGTKIQQINYNIAPLRFSDHRPVYATFVCVVNIIDEARKDILSRRIYEEGKARIKSSNLNNRQEKDVDGKDDKLILTKSLLPLTSSNRQNLWLDNHKPACPRLEPPQKGMIPNPKVSSNLFTSKDEPDSVKFPETSPATMKKPHPSSTTTKVSQKSPIPIIVQSVNPQMRDLILESEPKSFVSKIPFESKLTAKSTLIPSQRDLVSTGMTVQKSATNRKFPPIARKPVHLSSPTLSVSTSIANSLSTKPPNILKTSPISKITNNQTKNIEENGNIKRIRDTLLPPPPPPPPPRKGGMSSRQIYKEIGS